MLSRSSIRAAAPRTLLKQKSGVVAAVPRSGMATATTPGLQYEVSDSAGVKVANRETGGPTGTLALVAKAGSRYQPFPGFADALEQFAFQSTLKRSALRITREVELLGGAFSSTRSRENVVLHTKFLSNDLPYFTELLAEVASQSKFAPHELDEHVINLLKLKQQMFSSNPEAVAIDAAHGLAFHRGLGTSITPSSTSPSDKYLTAEAVAEYAKNAYAKSNIALVGSGPSSSDLSQSVSQFFQGVPSTGSGSSAYKVQDNGASKYHGGEQRIASKAGNAFVLAFPGSSAFGTAGYKPAVDVLAALLGGESTIKWTPGFSLLSQATKDASRQVQVSTSNHSYSDAGLLTVSLTGNVDKVASTGKTVVDVLKKVAAGDVPADEVKKAAAYAKFRALESIQTLETGLEASGSALINNAKPYQVTEIAQSLDKVTEQNVKETAKSILGSKASVVAVGDLFKLPYASDLGLTV